MSEFAGKVAHTNREKGRNVQKAEQVQLSPAEPNDHLNYAHLGEHVSMFHLDRLLAPGDFGQTLLPLNQYVPRTDGGI